MERNLSAILIMLLMLLGGLFVGGSTGEVTDVIYGEGISALSEGPITIPPGGGYDTSYYVKVARDVPVSSMSMSISTRNSGSGMAIEEPTVDLGMDGRVEWTYE